MVYSDITNNRKAAFTTIYRQQVKTAIVLWLSLISGLVAAQVPTGYYTPAYGKTGAELKTALFQIMSDPYTQNTYDFLYTITSVH